MGALALGPAIGGQAAGHAIRQADKISDGLFYCSAALSIAALLVNRQAHPIAYDWILIFFALAVTAYSSLASSAACT